MRTLILTFLYCSLTLANNAPSPKQLYREAEHLEDRLLFESAFSKYGQVLHSNSRLWKRRAAFRIATLVRDIQFSAGRSESVRPYVVSLYKTLLLDLPTPSDDPELWIELRKEIRWTRLGLKSPPLLF